VARRIRIKVCCIASHEEARLAIEAGADAIGLVARMPSGPGPIDDALIGAIATATPPPIATFLLTAEVEPDAVVAHIRRAGTTTVQLVDDTVTEPVYRAIRIETPWVRVAQVIHVRDASSIELALRAEAHADVLLLDSGNPAAPVRELGGTGRTHDWDVSRAIVERSRIPVFLAGGLHAGNVRAAIDAVRPFGVDVCSGVRVDGRLDADRLGAFIAATRA
jgi:phosphoribosylanthranilate isomerase